MSDTPCRMAKNRLLDQLSSLRYQVGGGLRLEITVKRKPQDIFDRLAAETLQAETAWLEIVCRSMCDSLSGTPLLQAWLRNAEASADVGNQLWTNWLQQAARLQTEWLQHALGLSLPDAATGTLPGGDARRRKRY